MEQRATSSGAEMEKVDLLQFALGMLVPIVGLSLFQILAERWGFGNVIRIARNTVVLMFLVAFAVLAIRSCW